MASCEKCWADSYLMTQEDASKSHSKHYADLIEERMDNPCSPEEQAGLDATVCPKCKRKTVHQYVKECMNCKHQELWHRK